jgi:1-acyl-sn-glycerol-3-phosphate acyltransferase
LRQFAHPIDPDRVRRSHRWIAPIMRRYFRTDVRGLDRIPDGQQIIVASHDGGVLPLNGFAFAAEWYERFGFDRPLYVLVHEIFFKVHPRVSKLFQDSGMIPADRDSMDRALSTGASVLVFPGAARETFRTYRRRADPDLGGRTGFVAQAIRWRLPITPLASAGSHETLFVLSSGRRFAERIGLRKIVRSADVWPILAGLPWGVWALPFLPHFPLPAKITVEVEEPVRLGRHADVDEGFREVLARVRAGTRRLYDERRFPVIG